jgi:hypothetical protein
MIISWNKGFVERKKMNSNFIYRYCFGNYYESGL